VNVASATQRQWYTRRDDEKFASVDALLRETLLDKAYSRGIPVKLSNLMVQPALIADDESWKIHVVDEKTGTICDPTNWSFGQLCHLVGAHPSYLQTLPASLVTQCLSYGILRESRIKDKDLELFVRDMTNDEDEVESRTLRAVTGGFYGRLHDAVVVNAAMDVLEAADGKFEAPLDWTKEKRSLFRSDRDLHMLFVDGGSIVDEGYDLHSRLRQQHRGWLMWNSDVGAGSFKLATFLFDYVCGNFMIHGIDNVKLTKIRHTINAPQRFVKELLPEIMAYVEASPVSVQEAIKKARNLMLPKDSRTFTEYFQHRKFTKLEIERATELADKEEGDHATLWQMINGFTAYARSFKQADKATDLSTRAGRLLERVAA
jgi:hypothetical protein